MLQRALTLCCLAALAACGSDKTSSSTSNTTPAVASADGTSGTVTPTTTMSKVALNASKMAQQSTSSTQNQADQSETATSGSDDSSGTSKVAEGHGRGGVLGIHPQPGIDFNVPLSVDFNVALNFNAYVGPDSCTANGNVNVSVRHNSNGDNSILLQGAITQTYSNGREIHQSTEPNITVVKQGTRASGHVVREITGIVRRALTQATDPNNDFNFLIDHTGTVVTDSYVSGSLTSRAITGSTTITDSDTGDSAVITFNDVIRPAPATCLCPTEGSITTAYTHAGATRSITHAFGGTCGQVTVTEQASAAVSKAAGAESTTTASGVVTSSGTATGAAASATTSTVVTWDFCTPT